MTEILNSFKDVTKERLKNPFIGSFIFAWIVFNWKPIIYIILSKDTIESRIQVISQYFSPITNTLIYPLLFALIYIIVLPYLMWLFEELYIKAIRERLNNKKQSDLERIERSIEITRRSLILENVKADYKETQELNDKIENLNIELGKRENEVKQLKSNLDRKNNDIYAIQTKVEERLVSNEEKREFDNEYELFKKSILFPKFKLVGYSSLFEERIKRELMDSNMAEKFEYEKLAKSKLSGGYYNFSLTKKGKYFWDKYASHFLVNNSSSWDFK